MTEPLTSPRLDDAVNRRPIYDDTAGSKLSDPDREDGVERPPTMGSPVRQTPAGLITRHFRWVVLSLCLVHLGVQVVYILRLPLVMDEFAGARAVYRLTEDVPYRDFRPYKTVLGYLLQLPTLLAARDPWTGLMWTKIAMAIINASALLIGARALAVARPRSQS